MKYLYCVIPSNKPQTFDVPGIAAPAGGQGGQVYTVPYQDISLVVSDNDPIPFTSIGKEELLNLLLKHQSTVEKIMQEYSVIPIKFGTFLDGEKETQKIVAKGYPLFKESLQALNGKIELNLAAIWANLKEILKEIGETEEIQRLKDAIFQAPLSERVQSGIELGKMVKNLLDQKRDEITEAVIAVLREKTLALSKQAVLNDDMIANVAFLIDKDKKEEFEQALDELDKKYEGKINFKLVGPLPPYSFATFEIKELTPEEIADAKVFLGITGEPSPEDVKQAYHTMAQKLHPDKNPGSPDATNQFEELKKAFEILYEYSSNGRDLFFVKKLSWEQQNTKF